VWLAWRLNRSVTRALPTGTVTFLFTDIEGSTRLLQQLGASAYADALAKHRRVLREAFLRHDGVEVDTQGDAFFVAFPTAPGAVAAAAEAQQAFQDGPISVRIGIHTGTPHITDEGYVGPDVHRAARIAAAGHGGQVLVSSSTATLLERDGLRDLGDHRLKDLAAPERIYQIGAEAFPPLKSLQRTNLPIPPTPFLGREHELREVVALIEGGPRLLTLTGPAGTGKTRLALQAGAEASDRYPDGVYWVPLAALRDPSLVLEAAAQSLGTTGGLAERIGDRRLLLVLDNFEHLMDAAADLAALMASCPNVQLLVTSREVLRLPGEQVYPVSPLHSRDAVEFFISRAQATDPRFEASPIVEQLCAQLDNLPLALELAATRVGVLSPEQLLARLSKRLNLLKAGRGVDPRQQTLWATIAWSYDLLAPNEQRLFECLAAFDGGCSLEAAEEVCEADIDDLQSLVDKSLVSRQGERFSMLETMREFAAEQLRRRGDADMLADRHADYFIRLADAGARGAPDEDPERGRALYPDVSNIRRALAWLAASGDTERELRLAVLGFWCLWTRASQRELYGWLTSALEQSALADVHLRTRALGAAAMAASNLGYAQAGRAYANQALTLARDQHDNRQIEWALRVLSFDEPDLVERRRLLDECERLLRELGSEAGLGWVMYLRGFTFIQEGDPDRARETFEGAAGLFRRLGRRWEAVNAELDIGYALISADRGVEALPVMKAALVEAVDLDSPTEIIKALIVLAAIEVELDAVAATRLLAQARSIADEEGFEPDPRSEGLLVEPTEQSARARLGEQFEAEWDTGSSMTLEEAVALARDKM
jgi:predicted ATPase/class 3 adenylate cyclase